MSNISRPKGLLNLFLLVAIGISVCYLISCNQNAGGEQPEPQINADTVKNHLIPIGEAVQLTANGKAVSETLEIQKQSFIRLQAEF